MQIQKIEISKLKAAEYNPRKDLQPSDPEFEKLRRSIEEFGFVEPAIWNKRTGNIVGGHQRIKVLKHLGHTEADCVVVDLDENQEKALNIGLKLDIKKLTKDEMRGLLEKIFAEVKTTAVYHDRPIRSLEHPTMKPIKLCAELIYNSSRRDALVYDGFCGSGSTLIAADQLDRRCYACELDPKYCDAAVARYIQQAGGKHGDIFLVRDGQEIPYSELKREA